MQSMNSDNNKNPVLSHMRRSADVQTDSQQLEKLAKERKELKHVLQELNSDEHPTCNAKIIPANSESKIELDHRGRNTYFVKTTSFPSSFFQMEADDVEEIVEHKLQHVEKTIVKLCTDVQARLDSSA